MSTQLDPRTPRRLRKTPFVRFGVVALAFAFYGVIATRGDESRPALPKDGAWVRYAFELRHEGKITMKNSLTLSFVGTTVEEGSRCRWIEVKVVVPKGERSEGTHVAKLLVPERELLEDRDPCAHALRIWRRQPGDAQPERVKVAFTTGPNLMLWAPGSLDRLEQSEETKEFEYQQGRLKSARAWVGEQTIVTKSEARFVSHYKVWMHADVPVGFAGAEVEDTILHRDGRVIRQKHSYAIQDAGDGAKSELPDNN